MRRLLLWQLLLGLLSLDHVELGLEFHLEDELLLAIEIFLGHGLLVILLRPGCNIPGPTVPHRCTWLLRTKLFGLH